MAINDPRMSPYGKLLSQAEVSRLMTAESIALQNDMRALCNKYRNVLGVSKVYACLETALALAALGNQSDREFILRLLEIDRLRLQAMVDAAKIAGNTRPVVKQ